MLLLKRYGLPPLLGTALYGVLWLISAGEKGFFGWGLLFSVLLSYFIRICDDLGDYQKDRAAGKAPLGRPALTVILWVIAVSGLMLTLFTARYWMLLPFGVICVPFLLPMEWKDWIKPAFLPVAVITVAHSFFALGWGVFLFAGILLVADAVLILGKGRKEKK